MATFKSIVSKFRKDLNNAYRSRKSVLDVTDEYLKQLEDAEFDGTGVTPEQMEAVTGDLDDLTTTSKTNLVSAINELDGVINKGSVSVTADGVKTARGVLNELYALIDTSKLNANSKLIFETDNIGYFSLANISSGEISFSKTTFEPSGSSTGIQVIQLSSSESGWYSIGISSNSYTVTPIISNVLTAGYKYTVVY